MSEGRFERSKYETDAGNVIPMRVQPETLAATIGGETNAEPAGDILPGWPSVRVGGGRREIGVNGRFVTGSWQTPPTDYDGRTLFKLVIPTKSVFDGIAKGQSISYLGGTAAVVSVTPEKIN